MTPDNKITVTLQLTSHELYELTTLALTVLSGQPFDEFYAQHKLPESSKLAGESAVRKLVVATSKAGDPDHPLVKMMEQVSEIYDKLDKALGEG